MPGHHHGVVPVLERGHDHGTIAYDPDHVTGPIALHRVAITSARLRILYAGFMAGMATNPHKLVQGWAWLVSGFLVVVGAFGLFTEQIGPLPTNRIHAIGLNLGVGLVGFGFARFGAEALFVLISGIGMLAVAALGFFPATHHWLYVTLHMNRTESYFELAGGIVSLVLWWNARRKI
jgi:hypothetical protein